MGHEGPGSMVLFRSNKEFTANNGRPSELRCARIVLHVCFGGHGNHKVQRPLFIQRGVRYMIAQSSNCIFLYRWCIARLCCMHPRRLCARSVLQRTAVGQRRSMVGRCERGAHRGASSEYGLVCTRRPELARTHYGYGDDGRYYADDHRARDSPRHHCEAGFAVSAHEHVSAL